MDKSTLIILLAVGAVLFVVWRRTEIDLINAQSHAASVAGASALINQGAGLVIDYYTGGAL